MIFGYTCLAVLAQFFFQLNIFCENVYVDPNGEVPAAFGSAQVSSFSFFLPPTVCKLCEAIANLSEMDDTEGQRYGAVGG